MNRFLLNGLGMIKIDYDGLEKLVSHQALHKV